MRPLVGAATTGAAALTQDVLPAPIPFPLWRSSVPSLEMTSGLEHLAGGPAPGGAGAEVMQAVDKVKIQCKCQPNCPARMEYPMGKNYQWCMNGAQYVGETCLVSRAAAASRHCRLRNSLLPSGVALLTAPT